MGGVLVFDESVNVDGIQVEGESGLGVNAGLGKTAGATVNGEIKVESDGYVNGVRVNAAPGSEILLDINGEIIATSEYGPIYGFLFHGEETDVDIDIEGGISVAQVDESIDSEPSEIEIHGAQFEIYGEDSDISMSVGDDIIAVADDGIAIGLDAMIINDYGNDEPTNIDLNIAVDGDISAEGNGYGFTQGIYANNQGVEADMSIVVEGDIQVSGESSELDGISAYASKDSNIDITVGGDVLVSNGGEEHDSYGVSVVGDNAEITIVVDGEIRVENDYETTVPVDEDEDSYGANSTGVSIIGRADTKYKETTYNGSLDNFDEGSSYSRPNIVPGQYDGTIENTIFHDEKYNSYRREVVKDGEGNTISDTIYTNGLYSGSIDGFEEGNTFTGERWVDGYEDGIEITYLYNDDQYNSYWEKIEQDAAGNEISRIVTTWVTYTDNIDEILSGLTKDEDAYNESENKLWIGDEEIDVIEINQGYSDEETNQTYNYHVTRDLNGIIIYESVGTEVKYEGNLDALTKNEDATNINPRWVDPHIDGTTETTYYYDENGKDYELITERNAAGEIQSTYIKTQVAYEGSTEGFIEDDSSTMPRWVAGHEDGKVVTTYYTDVNGNRYRSETTYNAEGEILSQQKYQSIYEKVGAADISVSVGEGITVVGKDYPEGIYAQAEDGSKIEVQVLKGGINVSSSEGDANGIILLNRGSDIDVQVQGDVNAQTGIFVDAEGSAETDVKIVGNVTSDSRAVELSVDGKDARTNILIDGTIAGKESSIQLNDETSIGNLNITVWQVLEGEDGALVSRVRDTGDDEWEKTQDQEAEKAIQYIIRITDPDIISTSGTTKVDNYNVAKEGETVLLKLTIPDGYEIDEVWQNEGKTIALLQDANQQYYMVVPRGGGVSLSVTLKEIVAPDPVVETPTPAAEEVEETTNVVRAAAQVEVVEDVILMTDEEIADAISDLLTRNDVSIEAEISVETRADGAKTIVIEPVETEAGSENAVLKLTLPTDLVETLNEQNATEIKMVSGDGNAEINMDVAEILNELAAGEGAQLIVECENTPVVSEEVIAQVSEKYVILDDAAIVVRVVIQDADGGERGVGASSLKLTLYASYQEGMKILYVDAAGNTIETAAVWVAATASVPGHWEVPYLGNGSYLPVISK